MGVDVGKPDVNFADTVRVGRVFGFVEQAGALGIGGQHPFDERRVAAWRFLRDVADALIARRRDGPVIRRDFAFQQTQQRGLAGTIAADEPDLVAVRNSGGCRIQDHAPFDPVGEVIDMKHRLSR